MPLYCQSDISKRERERKAAREEEEEKNRLSMLSIEFLWAMKGKISVFTTFMIAKYFYVRARVFLSYIALSFDHFSSGSRHFSATHSLSLSFSSLFLMASARFIVSICFEWVFFLFITFNTAIEMLKMGKGPFYFMDLWYTLTHSLSHSTRREWRSKMFCLWFYHNNVLLKQEPCRYFNEGIPTFSQAYCWIAICQR